MKVKDHSDVFSRRSFSPGKIRVINMSQHNEDLRDGGTTRRPSTAFVLNAESSQQHRRRSPRLAHPYA